MSIYANINGVSKEIAPPQSITQSTGYDTSSVMSQAAVTKVIDVISARVSIKDLGSVTATYPTNSGSFMSNYSASDLSTGDIWSFTINIYQKDPYTCAGIIIEQGNYSGSSCKCGIGFMMERSPQYVYFTITDSSVVTYSIKAL